MFEVTPEIGLSTLSILGGLMIAVWRISALINVVRRDVAINFKQQQHENARLREEQKEDYHDLRERLKCTDGEVKEVHAKVNDLTGRLGTLETVVSLRKRERPTSNG
ncbi:hypothetical protein ABFB09_08015 [Dehalogenimonas sp. THU2]|uniref:hypothetical protein n=1 Tax=Dehalogenimonas sp. THU2 TaxID=3151121 RepID=UPI003218BDFF